MHIEFDLTWRWITTIMLVGAPAALGYMVILSTIAATLAKRGKKSK
jgi:hypothetical protein